MKRERKPIVHKGIYSTVVACGACLYHRSRPALLTARDWSDATCKNCLRGKGKRG